MSDTEIKEQHCGNDVYVHGPHVWLRLSHGTTKWVTRHQCPGTGPMAKSADAEP